jgi:hypothetical protein
LGLFLIISWLSAPAARFIGEDLTPRRKDAKAQRKKKEEKGVLFLKL